MYSHRLSPRDAARLVGVTSTSASSTPIGQRTESKAEPIGASRTPEAQSDADSINRCTVSAAIKPWSANVDL
jgi:hypothetical protein